MAEIATPSVTATGTNPSTGSVDWATILAGLALLGTFISGITAWWYGPHAEQRAAKENTKREQQIARGYQIDCLQELINHLCWLRDLPPAIDARREDFMLVCAFTLGRWLFCSYIWRKQTAYTSDLGVSAQRRVDEGYTMVSIMLDSLGIFRGQQQMIASGMRDTDSDIISCVDYATFISRFRDANDSTLRENLQSVIAALNTLADPARRATLAHDCAVLINVADFLRDLLLSDEQEIMKENALDRELAAQNASSGQDGPVGQVPVAGEGIRRRIRAALGIDTSAPARD